MLASLYLLLMGQGGAVDQPERARGGDPVPRRPRRIKRQTLHPRGPTLRELFEPTPRAPAVLEMPEPAEIAAASPSVADVPVGTLALDPTPLLEGLESLRAALAERAAAQAIEADDAEVLMVAL